MDNNLFFPSPAYWWGTLLKTLVKVFTGSKGVSTRRMISSFSSEDQLRMNVFGVHTFCIQQCVKSIEIEKKSKSWMEKDDAFMSTLFIIVQRDGHQVDRGWMADHLHIRTTFSSGWSSKLNKLIILMWKHLKAVIKMIYQDGEYFYYRFKKKIILNYLWENLDKILAKPILYQSSYYFAPMTKFFLLSSGTQKKNNSNGIIQHPQ